MVTCRVCKGYAEIRLIAGTSLLSSGGVASLEAALAQCSSVHAILFEIFPKLASEGTEQAGPDVAAVDATKEDNGDQPQDDISRSFDALLQKLGQQPQLLIGFASGDIGFAESCIFASCDVLLAAADASFQLLQSEPLVMAPLVLLRKTGMQLLEHLPVQAGSSFGANVAKSFGFVSELAESDDALRKRRDDLAMRFQRSPAAAAASLKWLQKRSGQHGHTSTLTSAEESAHRGSKRQAECWVPMPVKRLKVARESEEGFHQRCASVAAALEGCRASQPPNATEQLLEHLVRSGTAHAPEQRSDVENGIVDVVAAALSVLDAKLAKASMEATAMLEAAEGERMIRDAAILHEESKLIAARGRAAELRVAVAKHNGALREAMQSLTQALDAQESGDARFKELSEEKSKLEALDRDVYGPTKLGQFAKAKANKNAKELMLTGKGYNFDESLLTGLPGALTKKPDDRTGFDNMVLSAFESQLFTKIAEAETSIAEEMPGREARAAVVTSARHCHETVKERQSGSLSELSAAQAQLTEGEVLVKDAQRSLRSFDQQMQSLVTSKAHADMRLEAFRKQPLAAFEDLRAGSADSHAIIIPEAPVSQPDGDAEPEPMEPVVEKATPMSPFFQKKATPAEDGSDEAHEPDEAAGEVTAEDDASDTKVPAAEAIEQDAAGEASGEEEDVEETVPEEKAAPEEEEAALEEEVAPEDEVIKEETEPREQDVEMEEAVETDEGV
jgi:enoyl-CoA hydratase/carnithine racemase